MKTLIIFLLAAIIFLSCDKRDPAPKPTIVGIWKGNYSNSLIAAPTISFIVDIKADGTLSVEAGSLSSNVVNVSKGTGTYTLSTDGQQLTGTYKYPTGTTSLGLDLKTTAAFTDLNGTWSSANSIKGKVELKKQ